MSEFSFKIEGNKMVSGQYPEGLDSLCAVVDVSGGLMKYGEENLVKPVYMELLKMYSNMNKTSPKDRMDKELLFIEFNKLELPLKYKAELMNYMIEVSLNGRKVKDLLEGNMQDLKKFLYELY